MSLHQVQLAAVSCLVSVLKGKNLTDVMSAYRQKLKYLSAAELSAWHDFCHGSLRYYGKLYFLIEQLVVKKLASQNIQMLLCVALYQLQYTKLSEHVIVNEAVKASEKINQGKFKSLVNAVLRRFLREQEQLAQLFESTKSLEAKYNLPLWWLERLQQDYPSEWQSIINASFTAPPLTLRVNRRQTTVSHYLGILREQDIQAEQIGVDAIRMMRAIPVQSIPYFEQGWVSIQDLGAQYAAQLLNPKDGDYILDACAAPGGKTGHLLELAQCELLAIDINSRRLDKVRQNLERLHLSAQLICQAAENLEDWYDGRPFDLILADIPCTASGVIKRHPDIKWLRRPQDAAQMAQQQHGLLDILWSCLKRQGYMLLVTCSIFKEENQEQKEHFLITHPDARCVKEMVLVPTNLHDGFYYALFQKD